MLQNIFQKYSSKKFLILFLIFIGFVLYLNSFFNELFWDDENSILYNTYIKSWKYLPRYFTESLTAGAGDISDYWRPLVLFSFSLDWKIGRLNPIIYHLHNTLLHVLCAILLFLIFDNLLKRRWLSFLIALVFLIHPLQTEAVTYVSGRADSLSSFFIFLALCFFLKGEKKTFSKWHGIALVAFIFSLLAKETAMVTPFLMMLILLTFPDKFFSEKILNLRQWLKIKEVIFESLKRLLPFLVILTIYISLRLTILNFENILSFYPTPNFYTENVIFRIYTFLKILLIYLGLIFYPHNLHMERTVPIEILPGPIVVLGFLLFLAMISLAIFDFLSPHSRTKENPQPPQVYFFGISWFFIALFPTSNILIPVNALLYEHWLYLPLIGIFTCFFYSFERLSLIRKSFSDRLKLDKWKNFLILILIFYLGFFCVKTILRNREWRDPIIFYNQILKYSESYRVYNNLGMEYSEIGEYEKAKECYLKAIKIDPNRPHAYNNLGRAIFNQKKYDEAILYFEKALSIQENFPVTLFNLGELYLEKKELSKAKEYFLRSVEVAPLYAFPFIRLASISLLEKDCQKALDYAQKAREILPAKEALQKNIQLLIEEAKRCQL